MTPQLALRSDLVIGVETGGIAIASDRVQHVLLGDRYTTLAPLLDGTRSEAEILESCRHSLGARTVLMTLTTLLSMLKNAKNQKINISALHLGYICYP